MLPYSKSLLIIPTFNEIDNIEKMLNYIKELYPDLHVLIFGSVLDQHWGMRKTGMAATEYMII